MRSETYKPVLYSWIRL